MQNSTIYLFRSIIRHLNGDKEEFNKLGNKAANIQKQEEFKKRCIIPVGELVPRHTRKKLYKMVN